MRQMVNRYGAVLKAEETGAFSLAPCPQRDAAMKGRLLIVDDDEVFCRLLKRHFEGDYAVAGFSDPEDAVRHVKKNPADVVLTDLSMPKMDGIEVLRSIKAEFPDTDVVVMTAYANVETAVEAMKKGAYDYIVKPFSLDELSMQLRNLFEEETP